MEHTHTSLGNRDNSPQRRHMNFILKTQKLSAWLCGPSFRPINGSVEPPHDKTNKMICAPSEDSDQPGHPPSPISFRSALNGYFFHADIEDSEQTWRMSAQSDLSLRWAHMQFCWFCHDASHLCKNWPDVDLRTCYSWTKSLTVNWAKSWENMSGGFATRLESNPSA